jgi:sugar/nucleoside kinase (ribokinase family)
MVRKGITLAGTVILDIVNVVDHWPDEEKVALIQRTQPGAGGPPHNAGAGLVKLGAPFPVTLIGAVGDDPYADTLIEQAQSYGLDTSSIRPVPGAVTSHTIVMSSAKTGKRTFFHQPGVNAVLTPEMMAAPAGSKAKIYYLGSPGIAGKLDAEDGWLVCLQAARAGGCQTAFELVSMPPDVLVRLVAHLLPLIDIFVVNDHEAAAISGMTVTRDGRLDVEAALAACGKLLDMGVGAVAGIHHPDGAVAVTRSGETAKSGSLNIETSEIVGSLGAGDAFYAGFLYGWHEDWPLQRCLELGNASAATSLFSVTTSSSIRPAADCLAFAAERGLRPL